MALPIKQNLIPFVLEGLQGTCFIFFHMLWTCNKAQNSEAWIFAIASSVMTEVLKLALLSLQNDKNPEIKHRDLVFFFVNSAIGCCLSLEI